MRVATSHSDLQKQTENSFLLLSGNTKNKNKQKKIEKIKYRGNENEKLKKYSVAVIYIRVSCEALLAH